MARPTYNNLLIFDCQGSVGDEVAKLLGAPVTCTVRKPSPKELDDTNYIYAQLESLPAVDGVICCMPIRTVKSTLLDGSDVGSWLKHKVLWQLDVFKHASKKMQGRPGLVTLSSGSSGDGEVADAVANTAIEKFVRNVAKLQRGTCINAVRPSEGSFVDANQIAKLAERYKKALKANSGEIIS